MEVYPAIIKQRQTVVRFLSYLNRANTGNYRQAIDDYLSGRTAKPDVAADRKQGRTKFGFGINAEQYLTKHSEAYGRLGWSDDFPTRGRSCRFNRYAALW